MKRVTMSTYNSQLYTYVKSTSILSKTNPVLANAPGNGELRLSITFNNFSSFKFWGGGSLNMHGSFFSPTEFDIFTSPPKSSAMSSNLGCSTEGWKLSQIPRVSCSHRTGTFLCLVTLNDFPASGLWWSAFPLNSFLSPCPSYLPSIISPLYYLSWSFSGSPSLLNSFLYWFCSSLCNPLPIQQFSL